MRERIRSFFRDRGPRVTLVRLQGIIAANGARGTLNHASLAPVLERAFRKGKPRAVAIAINSPGGSPVQSSLIAAHIRNLAEELEVPVHAFVEDVAASGGYWLATAADDIWVDDSSITGSIGVLSASFGFADLLTRHGVERRVHTAGEDKSMLDPFRPERDADVTRLKAIQARIHDTFIAQVRSRRGARLDMTRDLFTGEIFVGSDAVAAGLADGIGHAVPKLREIYGPKVRTRTMGLRRPLLQRMIPWAMADAFAAVEDRAAWARFGL
ncbi:S49 family peptidase [Jannaschia sp. S6380]|uniref:S49 family peptidase n=1 Tax=Jannaschia sp. S6380 TaxID=2926408 RepID=UPI001FF16AE0|nr:S49 family peptidase [Jannaschia sp. S6380]MCK0169061.1 S49 family peptidase [Jannaschia sp. S6380]